jgi:hypothetical protein
MQPVNDPPVAFDAEFTVQEDGVVEGTIRGMDPDGDPITFGLGCPPKQGDFELLPGTTPETTRFRYTPFPDETGHDSFVFTVSDGLATAYGQVGLTIQAVDDPPVAEDLDITVYSGRNTVFNVPGYDPEGAPVELFILAEPKGGAAFLQLTDARPVAPGSLRRQGLNPVTVVVPADVVPDYSRIFSYVVKDTVSGKVSNEARVHVLVRSPEYWNTIMFNQPPSPESVTLNVNQSQVVRGLLNATDDIDTIDQLTFTLLEPPASGADLVLDGRDFTYTPDPDFWGADEFTFEVRTTTFCLFRGITRWDSFAELQVTKMHMLLYCYGFVRAAGD